VLSTNVEEFTADSYFGSSGLTDIRVADDNPYFEDYDDYVLTEDKTEVLFVEESVTEFELPKEMTAFDVYPFSFFAQLLESISVEEGNTKYVVKDGALYTADMKTLILCTEEAADTFIVPYGVENIGKRAFAYSETLEKVVMKDGVTSIANYVFSGCNALEQIFIPDGVTLPKGKLGIEKNFDGTIYTDSEEVIDYAQTNDIDYVEYPVSQMNTLAYTNSADMLADVGGDMNELQLTADQLFGYLSPDAVDYIVFEGNMPFQLGYTNNEYSWDQRPDADQHILYMDDFDKYGCALKLSVWCNEGETKDCSFTWNVYTKEGLIYQNGLSMPAEETWNNLELSWEQLFGSVEPTMIDRIVFNGSAWFQLGYNNTAGAWTQTPDASEHVLEMADFDVDRFTLKIGYGVGEENVGTYHSFVWQVFLY